MAGCGSVTGREGLQSTPTFLIAALAAGRSGEVSGNDTYNSRFRGIARESVFQCILCAGLCQVVKVFYEYFVCSYDLCLAFFRGCQDKVKDACLCVFLQV